MGSDPPSRADCTYFHINTCAIPTSHPNMARGRRPGRAPISPAAVLPSAFCFLSASRAPASAIPSMIHPIHPIRPLPSRHRTAQPSHPRAGALHRTLATLPAYSSSAEASRATAPHPPGAACLRLPVRPGRLRRVSAVLCCAAKNTPPSPLLSLALSCFFSGLLPHRQAIT